MSAGQRMLLLVRHSAVQLDPNAPSHQWRLSEEGRERCGRLLPQVVRFAPSVVITSEENKARETGGILASGLDIPQRTVSGLHEHDRTGVPFLEERGSFEAAVLEVFEKPDQLVLGRETAIQALDRFDAAVRSAVVGQTTGNVAIVAHGTVMTLFICRYNPPFAPAPIWRSLRMPSFVVVSVPAFTIDEGDAPPAVYHWEGVTPLAPRS